MARNNECTRHFVTLMKILRGLWGHWLETQYCVICSYFYYYCVIIIIIIVLLSLLYTLLLLLLLLSYYR